MIIRELSDLDPKSKNSNGESLFSEVVRKGKEDSSLEDLVKILQSKSELISSQTVLDRRFSSEPLDSLTYIQKTNYNSVYDEDR